MASPRTTGTLSETRAPSDDPSAAVESSPAGRDGQPARQELRPALGDVVDQLDEEADSYMILSVKHETHMNSIT